MCRPATRRHLAGWQLALGLLVAAALWPCPLPAQTLRERLQERRQPADSPADADTDDLGGRPGATGLTCADWARRVQALQQRQAARRTGPVPDRADEAYGPQPLQTLDVYLARPAAAAGPAPVILLVHGGAWCVGDKRAAGVVTHKVSRWTSRGFIVVSANYPMVAQGSPALAQARHIAAALAHVQQEAGRWGGDRARVVLMGHSAGAHLVSLVHADAALRREAGASPALGTVSLDAGAIDVVAQMARVGPLLKTRYLEAFGSTEAAWMDASPFHRLQPGAAPWLGVCATTRQDDPCGQARAYAARSQAMGLVASVQPEPLGHGAINAELGQPGGYTDRVEAFLASLDPLLTRLLAASGPR